MVESHNFEDLEDMCEVNRIAMSTLEPSEETVDLECTILSHIAIKHESLGNSKKALDIATKGYRLRLEQRPPNQVILAWTENNLGYTSNSANDHKKAAWYFERARSRWGSMRGLDSKPILWPTTQKTNLGRCLVYLCKYEEAQCTLEEAIKEFKFNHPVNWAMLA